MRASELVQEFSKLLHEIEKNGYSPIIDVQRQILNSIIKIYAMALKHQELKIVHGVHIAYFDDDLPLNEDSEADIKE